MSQKRIRLITLDLKDEEKLRDTRNRKTRSDRSVHTYYPSLSLLTVSPSPGLHSYGTLSIVFANSGSVLQIQYALRIDVG